MGVRRNALGRRRRRAVGSSTDKAGPSVVRRAARCLARERALGKINRLSTRSVLVRRLRPPAGQRRPFVTAGRAWLMGGAVVEVTRTPVLSILESAAKDAGVRIVARSLDLGSDGAAVARSVRHDGSEAILRVAADATRTDPTWATRALDSLRCSSVAGLVPEALAAAQNRPHHGRWNRSFRDGLRRDSRNASGSKALTSALHSRAAIPLLPAWRRILPISAHGHLRYCLRSGAALRVSRRSGGLALDSSSR